MRQDYDHNRRVTSNWLSTFGYSIYEAIPPLFKHSLLIHFVLEPTNLIKQRRLTSVRHNQQLQNECLKRGCCLVVWNTEFPLYLIKEVCRFHKFWTKRIKGINRSLSSPIKPLWKGSVFAPYCVM